MDLESRYRDACHKLIASIDVRSASAQAACDAAALHRTLAREANHVLSGGAADLELLEGYRKQVVTLIAKLEERDELRRRDCLPDALHDFLTLGQKLGYAIRPAPEPAPTHFAEVEKELASLQAELTSIA